MSSNSVTVSQVSDVTTVEIVTAGPQGPAAAGFEFNGYHFYNAEEHLKASDKNMMPWWWRENHKYIISAKKAPNLIPLKKICYLSLTNCERKEIWVMLNKSLKEPPL